MNLTQTNFTYSYQEFLDFTEGNFLPDDVSDRAFFVDGQLSKVKGRVKSSVFNVCCTISDLNIRNNIPHFSSFPEQQKLLVSMAGHYANSSKILPKLRSQDGYFLKSSRRDAISAVLMSIIASTCFHTQRIGRYKSSGEFEFLSKYQLAKLSGFTRFNAKLNQYEIQPLFDKAYQSLSRAGYILSNQIKKKSEHHGWTKSYKFVSPKLFEHLRKAYPSFVSNEKYLELKKTAKKRWVKNAKKCENDRLANLIAIESIENRNAKKLKMPNTFKSILKKRSKFIYKLRKAGFYHYVAELIASYCIFDPQIRTKNLPY
ncbi:MAG: hypothetical protein MJK11_01975 [Pseudomonadales bacterium]|nr:hypothetical protein [Pseudomonadales bacterium]